MLGNDLATLPDFPAEIRAPAGTLHGVSAFQIHFASRDILTPGDYPNVLVAMNPAALKTNLEAVETRRHRDRQRGRVHRQQPAQGRLRVEPARRRLARRLPGLPCADDQHHGARDRADRRRHVARRRARQEPLRARARLLDVRAADGGDRGLDRAEVLRQAAGARRQPRRLPRRLQLRRDRRAAGASTTRSSPPRPSPARTATSTGRPRWRSGSSPPAFAAACRSSMRAIRSRPHPSSCTSCRGTSASACARCRPRTRSPPSTSRSAPPSAGTSASPRRAARAWT